MRSTCIINHTHNKLCAYVQTYIYVQVSQDSSIKKDVIHMPQALKQTHILFLMIFTVFMSSLDFWSAVDKDKAPDSSNDTIRIQLEH